MQYNKPPNISYQIDSWYFLRLNKFSHECWCVCLAMIELVLPAELVDCRKTKTICIPTVAIISFSMFHNLACIIAYHCHYCNHNTELNIVSSGHVGLQEHSWHWADWNHSHSVCQVLRTVSIRNLFAQQPRPHHMLTYRDYRISRDASDEDACNLIPPTPPWLHYLESLRYPNLDSQRLNFMLHYCQHCCWFFLRLPCSVSMSQ